MRPQDILNNTESAIQDRWPTGDCHCRDQIYGTVADIKKAKLNLKTLKKEKRSLSQKMELKIVCTQEPAIFNNRVSAIASDIKNAESTLKKLFSQLKGFFDHTESPAILPQRFRPFYKIMEVTEEDVENIRVSVIDDALEENWNRYVFSHPLATLYHQYCCRQLLKNSTKSSATYIAAFREDDTIAGVMPIFGSKSKIFGSYMISIPHFNYGGPLADSLAIERLLLEYAASICHKNNFQHLEVRSTHKINNWPQKQDKVSMLLQLPHSKDQLNDQLGAKVRSQIMQSRRHGLLTQFGGDELLDDFYQVFSLNMRDLGTPVHSKLFFDSIAHHFASSCKIVVVRLENKPIAAGILLAHREILEIPWASSIRSFNHLSPNMLMYAEVLEFAIGSGYSYFDFGRSSMDSPTYKFKKQWGAKPVNHFWHYWLQKEVAMPELNPGNPKYQLAISLWKKMPVWLTKIIGPRIVAYLP